ncbi:MAG TPA: endonuclease/exonuclease/phosphatase family protein [Myxococcota bacterium]|nr:endonuclease/exonuclease/phosphatase family protein [Myxococcota bacterium]
MALRLGTLNVWGLPEAFSDDVSSRMRALVARLEASPLDVLLVQEAWTEEVRDTLREGCVAAGFEVASGAGLGSSGGLMLLSRVPIRAARFERFEFRGDPERIAQGEFLGGKGFQTVVVEDGERPLTVINTHLHARYRRGRPRLDSAVRAAQLLQIVGALRELPGLVVVGGDFNCSRGDAEYEIFRGLARTQEVASGEGFATLSKQNFYKRDRSGEDKRIDFLFVRPVAGVRWRARGAGLLFDEPVAIRRRDRSFSDHFGFQAELDWQTVSSVAAATASRRPDPAAFDLADDLLDLGRAEANRRERKHFLHAGGFLGAAALAAIVRRHPVVDRRRFLRGAAGAIAAVALAPAVGYGALARVDSDSKRDALDDARAVLAELRGRA